MNRSLLEKPFEPAQIRQRKGRNGVLDYVEGHNVIHRLNEALDGAWSFEITHHEIREDEVFVLGKLSADGIAKMQFGVSQVTREKGSGALVSLGDDLKAAATDALKKCATFLGVGLPSIGRGVADVLTLLTIACLGVLFGYRLLITRSRALSRTSDYAILILIALPFVSGYLAAHPAVNPLPWRSMMLVHVLGAEALFLAVPFTKLAHVVLFFFDRLSVIHWQLRPGAGARVAAALGGKEARV